MGYLQTHDQVGNRAVGDRIGHGMTEGRARVGAALVLTAPFTPMLFMGEEWAASTPWQYFTSHEEEELATAVREGRRREFADHGWAAEDVPDPQDAATVAASTLRWDEVGETRHTSMLEWYRDLIALRRAEPDLSDPRLDRVAVSYDATARWLVVSRGGLRVVCNLAAGAQDVPVDRPVESVVLASDPKAVPAGEAVALPGESVAIVRVARRRHLE
jgi:maltooligosyltrehalose trehalohydrolase